eukprot:TRINITY_DN8573_c0_g1_i4.p1 TRINITY_DN8573_c0_g1~~TRINITY_DN8573_c0_g1_i4.p1  ORF type:complete len:121 (+),score=21.07 TRINITY_DN8573_c0_g1_i4:152-514(+)
MNMATAKKEKALSGEEIATQFQSMREELAGLSSKIGELQAESEEYRRVRDTLQSVDKGRKAYRLVGDVLVERNVGEVLPAVVTNLEQMTAILKDLVERRDEKTKALSDFQQKHKITMKRA